MAAHGESNSVSQGKGAYKQKYAKYDVFSNLLSNLVSLRGPSANYFWNGLERLGERLEELS